MTASSSPRSLLKVAVVVAGIVGLVSLVSWQLDNGLCGNTIIGEQASPDEEFTVVIFERNCGATTGFSTQVSVLEAGRKLLNDPGNVFIADTDHGDAPSGKGGGPEVRVHWKSPHELILSHHSKARVFVANAAVESVSIRYETF